MFRFSAKSFIFFVILVFWTLGVLSFSEKALANDTSPVVVIGIAIFSFAVWVYCLFFQEIQTWIQKRVVRYLEANRKRIVNITICILVLTAAGFLYWYNAPRITQVRKWCAREAGIIYRSEIEAMLRKDGESLEGFILPLFEDSYAFDKNTRERMNNRYRNCLAEKGIKPEDLFTR